MKESKWDKHELPIGEAIFLARSYRKMTLGELSDRSGVHRNSISEIERGCRPPRFSVLLKLAFALDVKLSRIVKKAESIKPAL